MTKTSRNLTRSERKERNQQLMNDYTLLINAGVPKMDAQAQLRIKYGLKGLNSVGAIVYSIKTPKIN